MQPTKKQYKIKEAFGLSHLPDTAFVWGLEPGLPRVPKRDPDYVFKEDVIRHLQIFWLSGLQNLKLQGDPSAGKTSLICQWHAALNLPLRVVSCGPTTEWSHLIGQLLPRMDGQGLRWQDGPVLSACREGSSVCLDEMNTLDPAVGTTLNAVLDGHPIVIPETGEEIVPAPGTRIFGTQNPVNSKAMVVGRNVQDVAFDDRWCNLYVDYLEPDLERRLVVQHLCAGGGLAQHLADPIAEIVVGVAHQVREAYRNDSGVIDKPLSTRVVKRWARLAVMYAGPMKAKGKSGLHCAINHAVDMNAAMAGAVQELISLKAGYDANLKTYTGAGPVLS